jgi:hypothetical protein
VDSVQTFNITTPNHSFEIKDCLFIEYPEGGDPGNYVRIKITNTDKADGASTALVTDDGAKNILNVDKDAGIKVYT